MPKTAQTTESRIASRITLGAFLMVIALVLLRATTSEGLRDPTLPVPGADVAPRGVGPAGSVAMDLACCVPALLVLARRLLDRSYSLRVPWSFMPLALLCAVMALSGIWASDKFAAAVTASHWVAGCAVLWAASQLVRSWLRLRFVAAVCVGLLGVLAARGVYYRLVEFPETVHHWNEIRLDEFKRRGWEPNSFPARQFDQKVRAGEMFGFNISPNSFAALLVMLGIVGGGIIVQRAVEWSHGDGAQSAGLVIGTVAVVAGVATWVLSLTQSKTAAATPAMAAVIFIVIWRWGRFLAAHATGAFFAGLAMVLMVIAAAVGHGLYHHSLPTVSLAFRWDYWVGAAKVFVHHPLLGVGWANFIRYYLQYRLPRAPEEVLDPHCFIVRFFVELGCVGALMLAWLIRLWWELTRPAVPRGQAEVGAMSTGAGKPKRDASDQRDAGLRKRKRATSGESRAASASLLRPSSSALFPTAEARLPEMLRWTLLAAVAWFVLSLVMDIDWLQKGDYIFLAVLERVQYLAIFAVITAVAALRSLQPPVDDPRPAPWILYAMLTAAGMLLVHNLIDFSLFETGILLTFMLLVGSVLGARMNGSGSKRNTPAVAVAFAAALIGWLIAVGFFLLPLAAADQAASQANDLVRQAPAMNTTQSDMDARKRADLLSRAELRMIEARELEPLNADYAYQAARIAIMEGKPPATVLPLLQSAIDGDPRCPQYYLTMAGYEERNGHDAGRIMHNYDQALRLDPNNVSVRIDYARALSRRGNRAAATQQYETAVWLNEQLRSDEPKKMSREEMEKVREEGG